MDSDDIAKVMAIALKGHKYIQWFSNNLNDKDSGIHDRGNELGSTIIAFWDEIFERIMCYPSAYNFNVNLFVEGDGTRYFDDVFFPIIAKGVGYEINVYEGNFKN